VGESLLQAAGTISSKAVDSLTKRSEIEKKSESKRSSFIHFRAKVIRRGCGGRGGRRDTVATTQEHWPEDGKVEFRSTLECRKLQPQNKDGLEWEVEGDVIKNRS